MTRAARAAATSRRRDARRRGPARLPGLHRRRLEQAHAARAAGDDDRAVDRCSSAAWSGATRRARTRATVGCGTLPRAARSLAAMRVDAGDRPAPRRCCGAACVEYPRFLGERRAARRRRCCASGRPAAEVAVEVRGASDGELPPSARFMLAVALYEAGAVGGGRGAAARASLDAQPDAPARARRARRGAAVAGPPAPRPPRRPPRRSPPQAGAGAAARTALFALLAAGADAGDAAAALALAPRDGRAARARARRAGGLARRRRTRRRQRCPAAAAPRAQLRCSRRSLRLRGLRAFARSLPVVDALALPERDRREQLAAHVPAPRLPRVGGRRVDRRLRPATAPDAARAARPRRGRRRAAGSTRTPSCCAAEAASCSRPSRPATSYGRPVPPSRRPGCDR